MHLLRDKVVTLSLAVGLRLWVGDSIERCLVQSCRTMDSKQYEDLLSKEMIRQGSLKI